MLNMRMRARPGGWIVASIEAVGGSDLEPPEEAVDVGGGAPVAPAAFEGLHLSKPSEEEEEMADSDSLLLKMSLGRACLAKAGLPPRQPRTRSGGEIGVKVSARGRAAWFTNELRNNRTEADSLQTNVLKGQVVFGGDWQRAQLAARKDGAGASSRTRVVALAAKDEAHSRRA